MAAMSATSALGGLGVGSGVRRQWGKAGISTGARARAATGARAGVYATLGEEKVGAITPSRGAFTAAALAFGPGTGQMKTSPRGSKLVARAKTQGPATPLAGNVFNIATEKLPGGDNLTNEGILGFFIAGILGLYLGSVAIRTFAVMIGFAFTGFKYVVMGISLVLLGVAAS